MQWIRLNLLPYLNIFCLHKIVKVLLNFESLQLFIYLHDLLNCYHFPSLTVCILCS